MGKDSIHKFIQDVRRIESEIGEFPSREQYIANGGKYDAAVALLFGNWGGVRRAAEREKEYTEKLEDRAPKILLLDVETCEMVVKVWSLRQDYIPPHRIRMPTAIVAWAAKWLGDPASKMIYRDQRKAKDIRDDAALLAPLWELLDEADIIVTKNGKRFDEPLIKARMRISMVHGGKPYSPVKHEDIEVSFRRHFRLPSYTMEYLAETFCKKYKKLKHKKFPGIELWDECEAGNAAAWAEMEKYNKHDVLVTEELRTVISPWGATPGIDVNVYHGDCTFRCRCGSTDVIQRGWSYQKTGKYKQYTCNACGAWFNEKGQGNNLLPLKKRMQLRKGPV
jgi:hypothetical protein